jgi:hypothetical protein
LTEKALIKLLKRNILAKISPEDYENSMVCGFAAERGILLL